jgi:hypothetical protein
MFPLSNVIENMIFLGEVGRRLVEEETGIGEGFLFILIIF